MKPGRLPDDHPIEIQARRRLRDRAMREIDQRREIERPVTRPDAPKAKPPRRWGN